MTFHSCTSLIFFDFLCVCATLCHHTDHIGQVGQRWAESSDWLGSDRQSQDHLVLRYVSLAWSGIKCPIVQIPWRNEGNQSPLCLRSSYCWSIYIDHLHSDCKTCKGMLQLATCPQLVRSGSLTLSELEVQGMATAQFTASYSLQREVLTLLAGSGPSIASCISNTPTYSNTSWPQLHQSLCVGFARLA
jgi:hypothetical protein